MPYEDIVGLIAPEGKLRASINLGNILLAKLDADTGEPSGVSVDIARALAERLKVGLEFLVFDTAIKSVEAVTSRCADIGFFAVDPVRGEGIGFTEPYLRIEGCYLVPDDSRLQDCSDVDRPDVRVAVARGTAYDLFLERHLKKAELVRVTTSQVVVSTTIEQGLEVAAGVKEQLEADMKRYAGMRFLPGRFMVIEQAVGLPRGSGEEARGFVDQFMKELIEGGYVARSFERHGIPYQS